MAQRDEVEKGHTPLLNVRVPRTTQDLVKEIAAERGETVTAVVLAALDAYIKKNRPRKK